jgi:2'-5' RNA ligase
MPTKPIWFIALLPPPPILAEVLAFKEYAAANFGSSRALRSPAHITLFPPFQMAKNELPALESELEIFSSRQTPFSIALDGFSSFPPRVIFVDVRPGTALNELQQALQAHLKEQRGMDYPGGHGFHPHMTVAFKDLRKSMFRPAWEYFQKIEYKREFPVEAIHLLRHDGKYWQLTREFPLKTSRSNT